MTPGMALGGLALAGGALFVYHHSKSGGDCAADWKCLVQDRAGTIKCLTSAAGCPDRVSASCQVALDLIYSEAGGVPTGPNPGIADAANQAYTLLVFQGTPGAPVVSYRDAVNTLDTLWQAGDYYEAGFAVAAIATLWGAK